MSKYSREDKVRLAEIMLASSQWGWLKSEFDKKAKLYEPSIYNKRSEFEQGVWAGIKWCMECPEMVKKEQESALKMLMQKVFPSEDVR